jgi:hypothetical protein
MYHSTHLNTAALSGLNIINRWLSRRGLLLISFALACFAFSPDREAFAVDPPPDGGYVAGNTAEGSDALFSLTDGQNNTAIGLDTLFRNTTGSNNTACGELALENNVNGQQQHRVEISSGQQSDHRK